MVSVYGHWTVFEFESYLRLPTIFVAIYVPCLFFFCCVVCQGSKVRSGREERGTVSALETARQREIERVARAHEFMRRKVVSQPTVRKCSFHSADHNKKKKRKNKYSKLALNLLKQIETKQHKYLFRAKLLNHWKWSRKSIKTDRKGSHKYSSWSKSINMHTQTYKYIWTCT